MFNNYSCLSPSDYYIINFPFISGAVQWHRGLIWMKKTALSDCLYLAILAESNLFYSAGNPTVMLWSF